MTAYRIVVDAADFQLWRADDAEVNGTDTFATLGEAQAAALKQAVPERDEWARCVRSIREATTADALAYRVYGGWP